ncbi:MAG: Geranylfarnesyl diphosphate synthase [Methanosaeta sp. PtaB.Bin039]|nr:MAG: Geranylfarnesyl diphosphate synthase [Methanosaeta sp. PtaB.Bin039]OPY46819.1 MAG: Geranylfarnesyl diphosphate synthase [Methanosaeta sp. PtaU1.Bin028]
MFSDWEELKLIEDGLKSLGGECLRPDMGEMVDYVLSSPGKRVRPLILLVSARAFGCPPGRALDAALAIELVHAASLVHDDILDGGVERRGAPSAVRRYGIDAALLGGDYLISRSIDLISAYGRPVIQGFARACMNMAEGEMLDLSRISSVEEYYQCVFGKTASLFASSARLGCMIGGASSRDQALLESYGRNLGLAYQIMDDLGEVFGVDQKKRSVKSSVTLPRLHMEKGSAQDAWDVCSRLVQEHSTAAGKALSESGGDQAMKDRLMLILDVMTRRPVNKCPLQRPLC